MELFSEIATVAMKDRFDALSKRLTGSTATVNMDIITHSVAIGYHQGKSSHCQKKTH